MKPLIFISNILILGKRNISLTLSLEQQASRGFLDSTLMMLLRAQRMEGKTPKGLQKDQLKDKKNYEPIKFWGKFRSNQTSGFPPFHRKTFSHCCHMSQTHSSFILKEICYQTLF